MNTCLVTKLKASVDNPDLVRLDWFRIHVRDNSVYGPFEITFVRNNNESTFVEKPVILTEGISMTQTYTSSRWNYAFTKTNSNITGFIDLYMPRIVKIDDKYSTIDTDVTNLLQYGNITTAIVYAGTANIDKITRNTFLTVKINNQSGNIIDFISRQTSLKEYQALQTIDKQDKITGNLSNLTVPDSLTSFDVDYTSIEGDISTLDLTNATGLTTFRLKNSPNVTGSISSFTALNPHITTVSFAGCNVES